MNGKGNKNDIKWTDEKCGLDTLRNVALEF